MFTPLSLGTNHMFGVDSYTPLTTNNFEIRLYAMDGSDPTENADLLTLSTNTIGNIKENQDEILVHYGNGIIKFPSKVTFDNVTWDLNCYCSPNVLTPLREWRKQVYDYETEKMGVPSQYFRKAYIVRYDGAGNEKDILMLPGVWPSGLDYGEYDQAGGNVVRVNLSLVVSKVIPIKVEDSYMN